MEKLLVTGHMFSSHDVAHQILHAFMLNKEKEFLNSVPYDKELFSTNPNANYILVYASPLLTLAKAFEHTSMDECMIAELFDSWSETNAQILRFFYRHQNQCLLVNIEAALGRQSVFWEAFANRFSINYTKMGMSFPQQQLLDSDVTKVFANAFTGGEDTLQSIYEELECVAQVHNDSAQLSTKEKLLGWHNFQNLQVKLENKKKKINELEARDQEKDLLTLQLQQAQEELKYYFAKFEQPSIVKIPSLAECVFNFCEDIDGTNWYYAEDRGRWSGPLTKSALKVPTMGSGNFVFEIDIEYALDPIIVKEMKFYVNGNACQIIMPNDDCFPLRIQAEYASPENNSECHWILEFVLPTTISPAALSGSKDDRKLGIFVRSLRVSKKRNNALPLFLKYKQEVEHKYHVFISKNLKPQKKAKKFNPLGFVKKIYLK